MSPFKNRLILIFSVLLTLLCSAQSQALSSDRSQAITVQGDFAELDEAKGTTTYTGNVIIQRGSMRIDADKVIIYNTKNKVTKIVAKGLPVRYQQKPTEREGLVIAKANTLEYSISEETLHLIDSASLQQEGTSLSGNFINYDVKKSVVKAGGSSNENERVRMVIPARSLKHNDE